MKISTIATLACAIIGLGLLITPASAGGYHGSYYEDEYNYPSIGFGYGCSCCSYDCRKYSHRYRRYHDYRHGHDDDYGRRYRSYYGDDYRYGYRRHHRHYRHHRHHRRHHHRHHRGCDHDD
jgi:hypothetical protein